MLFRFCFSLKGKQALFNIVYCEFQNCYSVLSHSVMSASVTPKSVARQAPGNSCGFSRQEYWSGLPWSNPRLQHCRQILYHLSYQGSPCVIWVYLKNKKSPGNCVFICLFSVQPDDGNKYQLSFHVCFQNVLNHPLA